MGTITGRAVETGPAVARAPRAECGALLLAVDPCGALFAPLARRASTPIARACSCRGDEQRSQGVVRPQRCAAPARQSGSQFRACYRTTCCVL
eukprot:7288658-Heterocapsa_arctica.AAC.1